MASPTILSFTLRDIDGNETSTPFYANYNGAVETVNGMVGTWSALGAVIDDLTDAQIVGGSIRIPLVPDAGWKSAPVEGQDVSDTLVLNWANASTRYMFATAIPAFIHDLLVNGKIDLTNADLVALLTMVVTGFTNGNFVNTAGQDLTGLVDAFQSDRKHRKQVVTRSKSFT